MYQFCQAAGQFGMPLAIRNLSPMLNECNLKGATCATFGPTRICRVADAHRAIFDKTLSKNLTPLCFDYFYPAKTNLIRSIYCVFFPLIE